jgi:glycosyltransferase involved in cell wall biosynthesis
MSTTTEGLTTVRKTKPQLIFMYNSLTVGGGLTFLKKFIELNDIFEIKNFSFNKLEDNEQTEISRANIFDLCNRDAILVANSVITALMLLFLPSKMKKIYVTHGYANAYKHLPKARQLLLKLVLYLGKNKIKFVACGDDEKSSLLSLRSDLRMIDMIHNSVDSSIPSAPPTPTAPPADISNQKLLFIGRISYQKGVDVLLDVVAQMPSTICLDLAGPMQSKEKKYGQLIDEKIRLLNDMGHKVSLLGSINLNTFNKSEYKCCILPSRYEGFAFLPLELSHLKIPYILSNCLGHKELLVSELDLKYSFGIYY